MKSPKDMKIIQIQLTNACINKCSNCTRFCGWHQKPFYMDFETFKKAVDSLQGFTGMIGIMGGQPTLNPQFQKMVNYLNQKYPEQSIPLIMPQKSFNNYRENFLGSLCHKKGLWSCLGKKYYDNFELIQDTFSYQCINDHRNSGQHQALLVSRKDLGISDNQFYFLRDNCWIQNLWSASITPKGCFFCQVAAALDMLFNGPGGWKIEKDWWKRTPKQFGDQLSWCQYCSACLKVPSKKGNDEIDIISNTNYELLKNKNAYKAKNKRYEILTKEKYDNYIGKINCCSQPYLNQNDKRIDENNVCIIPNKINVCFLCQCENKTEFEQISKQDLQNKNFQDWCIIVTNKNFKLSEDFTKKVYNNGVIYINQNFLFINNKASSIKNNIIDENIVNKYPKNKVCYIQKFTADKQDIKYSFLVPTYNSSKTVLQALDSILAQNYKNFDIFIVDDGSTDNTVELVKQYQKKYPQIKKIQINQVNSSAVISRNKLIDLADGDYSIWCDSDDLVNDNLCAFATFMLHKELFEIVAFPFIINNTNSENFYWNPHEQNVQLYNSKYVFDYFMFSKSYRPNIWSKVIKTSLLKKSKPQNIRIDLVDDHLFSLILYYNCQSYKYVNCEKMYTYNIGLGEWDKKDISFQNYKRNCQGIINALIFTKQFLSSHYFSKLYLQKYYQFSCIQYLYNLIYHVKQSDKYKAVQYLRENEYKVSLLLQ